MSSSMILGLCPPLLLRYVFFLSLFPFSHSFLHCLIFKWKPYVRLAPLLVPINPPCLPWLVYVYILDGFARECAVGHNTNVMGYHFLKGTSTVSSFPLLALSFLFVSYIPQSLVLTLSSFSIQPTVQEHEELVWLSGNFKLEVTEYCMRIYGPRGFAH